MSPLKILHRPCYGKPRCLIFLLVLVLLTGLSLSACGKKAPPVPPQETGAKMLLFF